MTNAIEHPIPPFLNKPPVCRRCKCELRRIRRNDFMKIILFWLPLKRYRCHACLNVQWSWSR
jgi:hypothetical protein